MVFLSRRIALVAHFADHLTSPFPTIPQSTASATGARATPRRSRPPGTASPVYSRVKARHDHSIGGPRNAALSRPDVIPRPKVPVASTHFFPTPSLLPSQSNASVTGARVSTRTATRPPPRRRRRLRPKGRTTASATGAKTTPSTTHPASSRRDQISKGITASATGARIQTKQTLQALPASRSHPA